MKSVLLIDQDDASRQQLAKLVQWMGFVAAPVCTPDQALNVARSLSFGVVITTVARRPNDRRAITSELRKAVPQAAVVYVAENEDEYRKARAGCYAGVSGVIQKPVSVEALRRIVEYGMNGEGLYPVSITPSQERRRPR